MDILDTILPILISSEIHSHGHLSNATKNGLDMRIDRKNHVEKWNGIENKSKMSDIRGGGFSLQDSIGNITEGDFKDNLKSINGIYKLMYLSGFPSFQNKELKYNGDIDGMKRDSGNKYVKHLLAITALSDLLGGDLQFSTFDTGQPGILWNKRF